MRVEQRPLGVDRPVAVAAHAQLQPGEAGQPHLGAQPQQPLRFDLLDAPEVERLADNSRSGLRLPRRKPTPR